MPACHEALVATHATCTQFKPNGALARLELLREVKEKMLQLQGHVASQRKGRLYFHSVCAVRSYQRFGLLDVEVSLLPAQPALIFYLQGRILVFSGAPASSLPSNVHNPKTHSPALNPISL